MSNERDASGSGQVREVPMEECIGGAPLELYQKIRAILIHCNRFDDEALTYDEGVAKIRELVAAPPQPQEASAGFDARAFVAQYWTKRCNFSEASTYISDSASIDDQILIAKAVYKFAAGRAAAPKRSPDLVIERLPDWNYGAFLDDTQASCIAIGATAEEALNSGMRELLKRAECQGMRKASNG